MIEIRIIYNPETGAIQVAGPIANRVLCYGILEAAKVTIKEHDPSKPPLVQAKGPLPKIAQS